MNKYLRLWLLRINCFFFFFECLAMQSLISNSYLTLICQNYIQDFATWYWTGENFTGHFELHLFLICKTFIDIMMTITCFCAWKRQLVQGSFCFVLFFFLGGEGKWDPIEHKLEELRVEEEDIWAMGSRSISHHVSLTIY